MGISNNKRILAVVAIALLALVFYFVFIRDTSYPIKNYPPKTTGNIVVFGDSLVEGVGSRGGGFVSLLAEKLPNEKFINLGHSGDTTSLGLNRIDGIFQNDPKIVLVLLGGNDFLRQVPRQTTFSNLDKIVDRIQAQGVVVVLLGVRGGPFGKNPASDYKELAQRRGAIYVPDVLDDVIGEPELMSDSIHPNDAGYKIIADKIYPVLQKLLTQK